MIGNAIDISSLVSVLHELRPSFLDIFAGTDKPSPTAWLDGLRGWASLFVFCYHFMYDYHDWFDARYGRDGRNHRLIQLPFLCLVYAGPAMVSLFYVVSGFSLSLGPLKELRAGRVAGCHSRLASSTFRRPFRLLLPPAVVSAVVAVCVRLGFYDYGIAHHVGWASRGYSEPRPAILPTAIAQFQDWLYSVVFSLGNPLYTTIPLFRYDVHLYTIPIELRWSLILFLVIIALSRFRLRPRLFAMVFILLLSVATGRWESVAFTGGLILAHLALHRGDDVRAPATAEDDMYCQPEPGDIFARLAVLKRWTSLIPYVVFVAGLYLMSAPNWTQNTTPGYVLLSYLSPASWGDEIFRFLHVMGALAVTYAVSKNHRLQWLFNNRVSTYLGRISYSLYLAHGPMVHMLGDRLVPMMWYFTGGPVQKAGAEPSSAYEGGTPVGYEAGFLLGASITMVATVCVADLISRYVDEPIVRLCKKFETSMLEPPEPSVALGDGHYMTN